MRTQAVIPRCNSGRLALGIRYSPIWKIVRKYFPISGLALFGVALTSPSDSFRVFLLPFLSKFVELVESRTDFLHPLGQAISHGRRDRRLVIAENKPLVFEIP